MPGCLTLHSVIAHKLLRYSLLFLAASAPLLKAQQKLTLDPNHSEVHFTLSGHLLHTVHGTSSPSQQGEIAFDPATGISWQRHHHRFDAS